MERCRIFATPLEGARHPGYLAKLSGQPIDVVQARKVPKLRPGSLSIVVHAHGADRDVESFVEKFSGASLSLADVTVSKAVIAHGELTSATYPLAGFGRKRKVAVLAFRFDVSGLSQFSSAHGRFKRPDPTGKFFKIPFDLAHYR